MVIRETLIDWRYYTCGANGQIYSYLTQRYLSGYINENGYIRVQLKCIDGKNRMFRWHRVIWTFFYGTIPEGMEINHISEVKTENILSNLECVSHLANIRHGTGIERSAVKRRGVPRSEETRKKISTNLKGHKVSKETRVKLGKAVVAVKDGKVVMEFDSTMEAGRNGFKQSSVSACCLGKRKMHKGYQWYFKSEWEQMQQATHDRVACGKLEI